MYQIINGFLLRTLGVQLARPEQTLWHEGQEKREFDHAWLKQWAPTGRVLDLGASSLSMAREYCDNVVTFDQAPGADVVGDVHQLSTYFAPESFDAVVCTEVFEHTKRPWVAIEEVRKVLKPGGIFIGTGPLIHELHGEEYGDYWRITPQGWELLLEHFEGVEIKTRGLYPQINHVAVVARKGTSS